MRRPLLFERFHGWHVRAVLLVGLASAAGAQALPETLAHVLQSARVPIAKFNSVELNSRITSYAINQGDPFLLAYYRDDGSNLLKPPLHVIRYDRESGAITRSDLRGISALFQGRIPMNCLGSADFIREYRGSVYIDTHYNPSAGCVIVLSSQLVYKTALSGWLLGVLGADYAIVAASEIHFMSVHPLHVQVFDLKRSRLITVYPFENDPARSRYSEQIARHLSEDWCQKATAQCDPNNFDVVIESKLPINERARVFGFEAQFDAAGFGPEAEAHVARIHVDYIFRERNGVWEHREFDPAELVRRFQVPGIEALVEQRPLQAFEGGFFQNQKSSHNAQPQ